MDGTGSDSLESRTRAVVELSVRATLTALERLAAAGGGGGTSAATLAQILRDMEKDLTGKITELYRDAFSELQRDNRALKAEVGKLEAELKSNLTAAFQLEKQLRSQVVRLRREVTHLDRDLRTATDRAEKTLELLETERRQWTLSGPVHVLLRSGSVRGRTVERSNGVPVVSLYSNQTVPDPAALAMAILDSGPTGQTPPQPSAPLTVTNPPVPDLSSVPVHLSGTSQDAAAAASSVLGSSERVSILTTDSQGTHLGPAGQSADSPPALTVTALREPEPVDPQETDEHLSENTADNIGGKPTGLNSRDKNKSRKGKNCQKKVICEKCNKCFNYRHQLKKHMSCHDKPFDCDQCHKSFHKEKSLRTHLQAHKAKTTREQRGQNVWPCSQCDKQFSIQKKLEAHLVSHKAQKKTFTCSICERTYSTMHVLRRHEAVHTGARPFVCDTCGKGFTTKSILQEHQTIHTGEKPFNCATCGKSFRTSAHLLSHRRVHSDERPFTCSDCGKRFKLKRTLVQHQIVHTGEKPFVCQTCGIGFGLKNNLRRHLRVHTGEKAFRCKECGEEFSGNWAFKTHMVSHGAKKPFVCDFCDKTFFYSSKLLEHQQVVHRDQEESQQKEPAGLKSLSCTVCQKRFSGADTLRVHEQTHSEENKFICSTCGKCFHRKCTFVCHMRRHSEEKLDGCTVCGKRFLQLSRLKEHMTLHTGEKRHACEQCGKAFRTRNNFYRHARLHRGERPYHCHFCSRKFSQSNQLKSHLQIHTGLKLYSCDRCRQGFSDSRQLKEHSCGRSFLKPAP